MKSNPVKIVLKTQTGSVLIELKDIIFCRGVGSYIEFHLASKRKVLTSGLLKNFEKILMDPNRRFVRLHRSYLVNMDYILEYRNCSTKTVILDGNIEIPVAHRRSKEFLSLMKSNFLHLT